MEQLGIDNALTAQKAFFRKGTTLELSYREDALNKLKKTLIDSEQDIIAALKSDLRKPDMECYTSEIGMVIQETQYVLSNLKKWAKPEKVKSGILDVASKNYILKEPYGSALIIGPWNFPLQLTLVPLVGAIAAGNCAIVKPSELAKATSGVLAKIVRSAFEDGHVTVIEGGVEVSSYLLDQQFDTIFFTGSPRVGKIVMEKAAKYLTPVTLELGGKNPCIIDKDVDIEITAKRILWGKYLNSGQTCIAPDYLIVHHEVKEKLYKALEVWVRKFFGEAPKDSPDLARMINQDHFNRVVNYMNEGKIIFGGEYDQQDLFITPTVVEVESLDKPIMQEEIFGPVLPAMTFSSFEDVREIVYRNPNPLAAYLFSRDKTLIECFLQKIPFGGGCINDTIGHILLHELPFGGRGSSGIGCYHGKHSFDTFTHKKAILEKNFLFDLPVKYPPYGDKAKYVRMQVMKKNMKE